MLRSSARAVAGVAALSAAAASSLYLFSGESEEHTLPRRQLGLFADASPTFAASAEGAAAASPVASEVAAVPEEPAPSDAPSTPVASDKTEYIALFLPPEARSQLASSFSPYFDRMWLHHATLFYRPSGELKEAIGEYYGREVDIRVRAYARDTNADALFVSIGSGFTSSNRFPHITLSTTFETHPVYSNVLFERMEKATMAAGVDKDTKLWEGELPAFDSQLHPTAEPYAASKGHVRFLDEPMMVKAVLCSNLHWNGRRCVVQGAEAAAAARAEVAAAEAAAAAAAAAEEPKEFDTSEDEEYNRESGCSLCRLMKKGPCWKEFLPFERCLHAVMEAKEAARIAAEEEAAAAGHGAAAGDESAAAAAAAAEGSSGDPEGGDEEGFEGATECLAEWQFFQSCAAVHREEYTAIMDEEIARMKAEDEEKAKEESEEAGDKVEQQEEKVAEEEKKAAEE